MLNAPEEFIAMVITGMKTAIEKIEGLEAQTDTMCAYMAMPRSCKDSGGRELKVGDVLIGGTLEDKKKDKKRVLEVGYRWVTLSSCFADENDTEAKEKDGRWYEKTIKEREWKKA